MRKWVVFSLFLLGCQQQVPVPSPTPTPATVTGTATATPTATPMAEVVEPPFNPKFVEAVVSGQGGVTEGVAVHSYGSALGDLLSRERWDELEKLIAAQRKSLERFSTGAPKLTSCYFALESSNSFVPGDNHLFQIRRLALWLRKHPRSAAAHVVLARALQVFGEGKLPLPSVSQRGAFPQDFAEVNRWLDHPKESTFQLLERARALAPEDPEIWAVTMRAARLLHAPENQAQAWRDEAMGRFAGYPPLVGQVIQWELERDPHFAWWEVKAPPETLALACIYANLQANREIWPHLAELIPPLVESHPDSLYLRSKLANDAMLTNHHELGAEQLRLINYNYEPMGWPAASQLFFYSRFANIQPQDKPRTPLPLDGLLAQPNGPLSRRLLYWQVENLLPGRRYQELDAIGAALRKKPRRLSDGVPLTQAWYQLLGADLLKHRGSEEQEIFLRDWLKVRPDSYDARVGLIQILLVDASRARGGGWASEVSEEQWREFRQYHEEAWKLFEGMKDLDAYGASLGIELCRNLPDGKEKAYQFFALATRKDPEAVEAYQEMGMILLPRWAGKPGELQQFLKKSEKTFGPGLVGIVGLSLSQLSGVAKEEHFSDERILQSLEALAQRRPTVAYRNLFAATAFHKKNREFSRRAFAKLGGDWDPLVFLDSVAYEKCRRWANSPDLPYPKF